jgi:hypothetical protein
MQPMLRRRKYERFPTNAPVLFRWKANNLIRFEKGMTRDISKGGMYIIGAHAPPAKFVIRCQVLLPALEADPRPFACTVANVVGRVLRDETTTGPPNGFAIQCYGWVLNAR